MLPGGRDALTRYKVISYYDLINDKYTLVEVFPKTGRTHQIRIHLKYLGHPVVTDSFYAGRKTARKDRLWCPRLFLHAKEIKFRHPEKNEVMDFPIMSFQFEPRLYGKGLYYFDCIKLIRVKK